MNFGFYDCRHRLFLLSGFRFLILTQGEHALVGAIGKHRSILRLRGFQSDKSCYFKGLAILLRNGLDLVVYQNKPRDDAIGPWHPWSRFMQPMQVWRVNDHVNISVENFTV